MCVSRNPILSHIYLYGKQFIFTTKYKKELPSFTSFKIKFESRLELQRKLALDQGNLDNFNKTWEQFMNT